MADNAELHGKILGFLMAEWARKVDRQLVRVDLLYKPGGGFKDEEIRSWVRTDQPELFVDFVNIEKLVAQIVDIAEGEADAKPSGKHTFVLRCVQHGGSRPSMSFALAPSYTGGEETALVSSGAPASRGSEVAVAQVLASNNSQLMRTNQQMFDGTIRVLGQQTMNLHQQVSELTAENALLRRELEEARSNKTDRDFQIAMATEKNARTNAAFQKFLQIGSVVAAKIGGGNDNQSASASPLGMLIGEFYNSLRPEQMGTLMQSLDMGQKMMFMEIVNLVRPPEQKGEGQPAGQAPNAAPPR
jgi:predicted amino acid-binding ACT domain protein